MSTLTKREIAEQVSSKLGFSIRNSLQLVNDVFELMKAALKDGQEIKIVRFGTWRPVERKERKGISPADGSPIVIAGRRTVAFHPSRTLKKIINSEE